MHVSPSEQCNMNRVIFYSGVNGIMVTASHKIAYGQVFSRGREARGGGGSMRLTDWLYNSSISLRGRKNYYFGFPGFEPTHRCDPLDQRRL